MLRRLDRPNPSTVRLVPTHGADVETVGNVSQHGKHTRSGPECLRRIDNDSATVGQESHVAALRVQGEEPVYAELTRPHELAKRREELARRPITDVELAWLARASA